MPSDQSGSLPLCRNDRIYRKVSFSVLCFLIFWGAMEKRHGRGRDVLWSAILQRKCLSRLVGRRRIQTSINASVGIRSVKLAMDPSLAMASSGRKAWSRAIVGKYLSKQQKPRCQLRVLKSRWNVHGTRRLAFPETRQSRTGLKLASKTGCNCEVEAGRTVASRMQTLRLLVPGSRGLDTPDLLKETADYISVLKKLVQAMQLLADCCSNLTAHSTCEI